MRLIGYKQVGVVNEMLIVLTYHSQFALHDLYTFYQSLIQTMKNLKPKKLSQTTTQRASRIRMKVKIKKLQLLQYSSQPCPSNTPNNSHFQAQQTTSSQKVSTTKRLTRKMQNRLSAQRANDKKKLQILLLETELQQYKKFLLNCPQCKNHFPQEQQVSNLKEQTKKSQYARIKSNRGRKPKESDKSQQEIKKQKKIRKKIQKKNNRRSAQQSRTKQNKRKQELRQQIQKLKQLIENCSTYKNSQIQLQIHANRNQSQIQMAQNNSEPVINSQTNQQNQLQDQLHRIRQDSESSIWKMTTLSCLLFFTIVAVYLEGQSNKENEDQRGRMLTFSSSDLQFSKKQSQGSNNFSAKCSIGLPQFNLSSREGSQEKDYYQKAENQHQQFLSSLKYEHKILDQEREKYCSKQFPQLCSLNEYKRKRLLRYEQWSRYILEKKCKSVAGQLSAIDKLYFAQMLEDIQAQFDKNVKKFMKQASSQNDILRFGYTRYLEGALNAKIYKHQLAQTIKNQSLFNNVQNPSEL